MIRLAVSSHCLKHLPFESMLRLLGQLGFSRLEQVALATENSPDLRQWEGPALLAAIQAHQLTPIALYTVALDVHTPAAFEQTLGYIRHAMDVAAAMGVQRLVFTPQRPRENYDFSRLIEGCRRLCEYIGERDLRICLENHANWPLSTADDFAAVLDHVADTRLGITMDTGHFTAVNQDLPGFIERFGPRIFHVHLKDHLGPQCVPLGSGLTDNLAALQALESRGYSGYATLEIEVPDKQNTERYLAEARSYCAQRLNLT